MVLLTPAGSLLLALARACTLPVISVACEPTHAGMAGPAGALRLGLSHRRLSGPESEVHILPFLPLLLQLGHPVVRFSDHLCRSRL